MEFFKLMAPEEAIKHYLSVYKPALREVSIDVSRAYGRVLARSIRAPHDLPQFSKSTVDGYAVRAKDTFGASESTPALLNVTGEIPIGQQAALEVGGGEAVRIATGSMMPPGSDASVMVEYTEDLGQGFLAVNKDAAPGENVISRGEDLVFGQQVLAAGHRLRAQDIGVLSAIGVTSVMVYEQLRVTVLSTGNEIVPPSAEPGPGQVRDTNGPAVAAAVCALGMDARHEGIVNDTPEELSVALADALKRSDVLILSGGSSVGPHDLAPSIINSLGAPGVVVHGLAIKPGKPTILAIADDKPVFGLPGHPASALVVFQVVIEPILRSVAGEVNDRHIPYVMAVLDRNLPSTPGREDYIRVRLLTRDGRLHAMPLLGKSGLISTLVNATGLVKIPLESGGFEAGEMVPVCFWTI